MRDRIIQGLQTLINTGALKINDYATVRCQSGNRIRVEMKATAKCLRIEFAEPKPVVEIHKIFKVTPKLNAIDLGDSGIHVDLATFPDIDLTYDELEKLV